MILKGAENNQIYHIHYAYLMQQLLGLVRPSDLAWAQGDVIVLPEMSITVKKLAQVENVYGQLISKPQQLRIQLSQPLDSYLFMTWDGERELYRPFVLPNIGQSIVVKGMFN